MEKYTVQEGGGEHAYTLQDLIKRQISKTTLVFDSSKEDWVIAEEIPELSVIWEGGASPNGHIEYEHENGITSVETTYEERFDEEGRTREQLPREKSGSENIVDSTSYPEDYIEQKDSIDHRNTNGLEAVDAHNELNLSDENPQIDEGRAANQEEVDNARILDSGMNTDYGESLNNEESAANKWRSEDTGITGAGLNADDKETINDAEDSEHGENISGRGTTDVRQGISGEDPEGGREPSDNGLGINNEMPERDGGTIDGRDTTNSRQDRISEIYEDNDDNPNGSQASIDIPPIIEPPTETGNPTGPDHNDKPKYIKLVIPALVIIAIGVISYFLFTTNKPKTDNIQVQQKQLDSLLNEGKMLAVGVTDTSNISKARDKFKEIRILLDKNPQLDSTQVDRIALMYENAADTLCATYRKTGAKKLYFIPNTYLSFAECLKPNQTKATLCQ
ncbi:hypothetical protein [Emticicia fontis]